MRGGLRSPAALSNADSQLYQLYEVQISKLATYQYSLATPQYSSATLS